MTQDLAETILRDVPRFRPEHPGMMVPSPNGVWIDHREVLAALTAAMDPAIAERAGEVAWDETYDTMMEVERNPTGAFEAIQSQAASITALLAQNAALRADKEALHLALGEASKTIVETKAERDALRAEVEWWKQDDREAWDKCEERRIAQEAAEAQIAAFNAREAALHPDDMLPEAIRLIRQEASRDHSQEVVTGLKHIALLLEQLTGEART